MLLCIALCIEFTAPAPSPREVESAELRAVPRPDTTTDTDPARLDPLEPEPVLCPSLSLPSPVESISAPEPEPVPDIESEPESAEFPAVSRLLPAVPLVSPPILPTGSTGRNGSLSYLCRDSWYMSVCACVT